VVALEGVGQRVGKFGLEVARRQRPSSEFPDHQNLKIVKLCHEKCSLAWPTSLSSVFL
jgi:hypothetical protein